MQRKARVGFGLFFFLLTAGFQLSAQSIAVQDLLNWHELDPARQQAFSSAENDEALTTLLLESNNADGLFQADLLRRLFTAGAPDLLPRFIISSPDRNKAIDTAIDAASLYQLENQGQFALDIVESLYSLSRAPDHLLLLAELEYGLGRLSQARSRLSQFLRSQSDADSRLYFKSLYLLSRILVDEGNESQAYQLLTDQLSAQRIEADESNYAALAGKLMLDIHDSLASDDRMSIASIDNLRDLISGRLTYPDNQSPYPQPVMLEKRQFVADMMPPESQAAVSNNIEQNVSASAEDGAQNNTDDVSNVNSGTSPAPLVIVQLGSFGRRSNAQNLLERLLDEHDIHGFIFESEGSYKVLVDTSESTFRGSENFENPRRLLLMLKEAGIEGFAVADPRP